MLSLINTGISALSNWMTHKQKLKQAKQEGEIEVIKSEQKLKVATNEANIEKAKTGQIQDYNLDMQAAKNMEKSIKDELVLIIFMVPLVLSFIPGGDTTVAKGFEAISKMPSWYIYIVIGMIVHIYGLRGLLKEVISKKFGGLK